MANPVCFGDIILLDLNEHLLFSNAFFDSKVYLVNKDNIHLKTFRFGLFKILPNYSYKDISQVDNLKDQLGLLQSLNPDAKLAYEELSKDLKEEQKALEARDGKLDMLNEKIFNEVKGKPIKYGQKIELFHLESQTYLCPSKTSNKIDPAMMNLELIPKGNKSVYFKFMPMIGFIQEGDIVEYNIPLQVVSIKTESPIVKGPDLDPKKIKGEVTPASNKLTNNKDDFAVIQPRRKEPLYQHEKIVESGLKLVETPENTYVRRYLPFQDQEELKKKKILTNGDYIRITNDKVYLTAYPGREGDTIFFQSYGDHQDQKYSNIYTLFQIVEVVDSAPVQQAQKDKPQTVSSAALPRGTLLEYNENKKYILKHVVSGKILTCDKGVLKLETRQNASQDIEKVSVIIKNKAKDTGKERYIDRNAIMQLKFYGPKGEDQGILSIGKGIKLPSVNLEINTLWFYGFENTDNYLNKSLRTERFNPKISPTVDDKSSSLKFVRINSDENTSILLGESLANQFARYLDYLDEFLKAPITDLKSFNSKISNLADVCVKFEKQMYEENTQDAELEIKTPSKLVQTLLREFRIYDMFYRVFFFLIRDEQILQKITQIRQKFGEISRPTTAAQRKGSEDPIVQLEEVNNGKDLDFDALLKLLGIMNKIILISFKKNPLNRTYCSQFIRVPINAILESDCGVFSLSKFKEKMEMKEYMLQLCNKGLWDEDLDALGQLNYYEEPLFKAIYNQLTFHTIYLRMMEHISRSRAPNLDNKIRTNFVSDFLSKDGHMQHTFPDFVEENNRVYVVFTRGAHPENSCKVDIEELDEKQVGCEIKPSVEEDRIRMTTTYLIRSLRLLTALVLVNSSTFNLKIVRYYRYETLSKAIQTIKNSSQHREIRQCLGEILNTVHQKFFSVPFIKLPMKLQVLNEDNAMRSILIDVDGFIKKAVDTSLSTSEVAHMKSEDIMHLIQPLKSVITSDGDLAEVMRLIRSNPTLKNLEEARVVVEEVEKVLEAVVDIDLEFLQLAKECLITLLREAVVDKKKSQFDFIKQALEILTLIEHKMMAYAATDIIKSLQSHNLLGGMSPTNNKNKSFLAESKNDLNSSSLALKPKGKKVAPAGGKSKELSTKFGVDNTVLSNAIGAFSKEWKNGQKFNTVRGNNIVSIEAAYKDMNAAEIIGTLLDISLFNDDHLLSGIIQQLKRIASYESLLYVELSKLTIIHNSRSLEKGAEMIKLSFRLNEISREVLFCKDNKIEIASDRMSQLLAEVTGYLWKIFFTIYDVTQHFRLPDRSIDSEQRFKDAFYEVKKGGFERTFKMNTKAINRPFQKIFTILKVYRSLMKTLIWILESDSSLDEAIYAERLIIITLCAYLNGNRENQELFSNMNDFIRLFYFQAFLNVSPDTLTVFSEMLKGNKKLLKLPMKYLYDITNSTIINTLSPIRTINNTEANGYLSAAIGCFEFLMKCMIPEEIFNLMESLKDRWEQIGRVDDFTSLNVLGYTDNVCLLPFCYYSIRETMEITLKALDHFSGQFKKLSEMQLLLTFNSWLSFFESENYLLQYELKNLLTRCISKIYFEVFEFGKKGKFIQKFEECSSILACLVSDLLFFRMYISIKQGQDSVRLKELIEIPSFLTTHEQYDKLRKLYAKNPGIQFDQKKLMVYLEEISLHDLLYEYIYGGCLDLLFNILLQEVDHCSQIVDRRAETKTIMDFVLLLLDEFIQFEISNSEFPTQKFEKFLNSASVTRGYEMYKDKIVALTNKLFAQRNKAYLAHKMILTLHEKHAQEFTPLDSYNQHLESLRKYKGKLKEQNIKELADAIAEHANADDIIKQIVKYLKRDLSKLNMEEIKFLLRLLRKYIERENSSNPNDDPVYKWKDVSLSDLKKISKIQNLYQELGMTELLYSFLTLSDQKVFRETLMLSLAYMYGGNTMVQEEFFNNFVEDDENQVMDQLGKKLKTAWAMFRSQESERIYYLYGRVQKNLFDYFKEKQNVNQIDPDQLQIKAFETDIDVKFLEFAESYPSNKMFMLVLTFLQSLCERQFTNMQNFLREQTWKGRSYPNNVDVLGILRHSVNSYHKVLNRYNLGVGGKVLELITELIQGDVTENIRVLLNKTFIYDMCRIVTDYNSRYHTLPRGFGLDPFHEDFKEMKSQVIFVFKTMVENRNENNINVLTKHLDTLGLMVTFEKLMKTFLEKKGLYDKVTDLDKFVFSLTNEDFKDTLGDAINIYIIYRYIWEDQETFNERMRDLIGQMEKTSQGLLGKLIFTVFKRLVASIEIIAETKSEPLMRIWFPIIAVCNYLSDDTKLNFLNNVDRSNSQTKILGLLDAAQEFIPQMYTEYHAKGRVFGLNFKNLYYIDRFLTNIIGLTVTFLNIGTFKYNSDEGSISQEGDAETAADILNYIQIGLAGGLIIMWVLFFRTRHQSLMWERYVDENVKSLGPLPPTIKNKIENGDFEELDENDCRLVMMLKGANSDEFQEMKTSAKSYQGISKSFFFRNLIFMVKSWSLLWHLLYLGICIGSVFHPIVAIFQIFDIAIRSHTIKQISTAISKNAGQFVWTLFLLMVVNIVYSSLGFFFYNESFKMGDSRLCDTAFSCFMNVLNLGLRSGGGIADAIGPQPYSDNSVGTFVVRVIFDLSFFIIMIILLLNLIFGMIIDAFGELRDKKTSDDEDQQNVCFICGIGRSEFERHTSFDDHILCDHELWAYVYYIVYLLERQKTAKVEMTDIENLVLAKYLQKDLNWFPIGQSLVLQRIYDEEKLNKEGEMEKITKKIEQIQKNVGDIDVKLSSKVDQVLGAVKKA